MHRSACRASAHPIYPRPVSPLHYEPLYTHPDDVLWEDSETSDQNEEVRAAKRRKIEGLGEAYLRGEPLMILSAGIRGPLGDGWINPWAKKKEKRRRGGMPSVEGRRKEIPETVKRTRDLSLKKAKRLEPLRKEIPSARRSVSQLKTEEYQTSEGKAEEESKLINPQEDPFTTSKPGLQKPVVPVEAGETAWLKKDRLTPSTTRNFYADEAQQYEKSPSRAAGRPSVTRTADQTRHSAPRSNNAEFFDGRAKTLIKRVRRREAPIESGTLPHPDVGREPQTEDGTNYYTPPPLPQAVSMGAPPPRQVLHAADKEETVDGSLSRSGDEVEPNSWLPGEGGSSAPPNHSRGSEQRQQATSTSAGRSEAVQQPDPTESPAPSLHDQHHGPEEPKTQTSQPGRSLQTMPPPTLSTETTCTTLVSGLPSAQVAPFVQAPPPNESVPSTGDKLSEEEHRNRRHNEEPSSSLSTQAAIAAANLQLQQDLTTPYVHRPPTPTTALVTDSSTGKARSKSGITPFSAFTRPPSAKSSLNTQEMLDAATPFDLKTTVKKTLPNPPDLASPSVVAQNSAKTGKAGKAQKKKRTFFTTEAACNTSGGSSQGSIKTSMKTTKITAAHRIPAGAKAVEEGQREEEAAPSEFGKLGLDMETSEDEDGGLGIRVHTTTEADASRIVSTMGESKTTSGSKITNDSKTTGASAQDAQKVMPDPPAAINNFLPVHGGNEENENACNTKQREGGRREARKGDFIEDENEDGDGDGMGGFDLSAAMDEVGSFLQSWDTEKEVRELKAKESGNRRVGRGRGGGLLRERRMRS